jgi:hypothetical protein
MPQNKENYLYCFTPLVTLATFVVEFALGVFTIYKYRKTAFCKVAALGLFGLASFQFAEWMVCGAGSSMPDFWMRFGFVGTALLPAIGLHLVHLISDKKYKHLTLLGYVAAALVSAVLIFEAGADLYFTCMGKFVSFQIGTVADKMYVYYYIVFLGIAIFLLLGNIFRKKQHVHISKLMLATLLVFIVPTYVLSYFSIIKGSSVPSIMCGFAIFAAVLLVARILPKYHKEYALLA